MSSSDQYRVGRTTGRLLASAVVLTAAGAFLWGFGPRGAVHADIYTPMASRAGLLLDLAGEGTSARRGTVLINGAAFNYVVGHTRQKPTAVLDHYAKQFDTVSPSGARVSSATRLEANGAGVVAGMVFKPLRHPSEMADRIGEFAMTGRLAAVAQFHLISVFTQQGTVFIDFTPAPDVTVRSLMPPVGADAPGDDLKDVLRPAGLQRAYTIEHGDGATWSRTLIYRTADSAAAVQAFRRSLGAAGWASNPVTDEHGLGHFTDGRRECFLAGSGEGDNGVLILVHRNLSRGTAR